MHVGMHYVYVGGIKFQSVFPGKLSVKFRGAQKLNMS